jgi:hypothetical protein
MEVLSTFVGWDLRSPTQESRSYIRPCWLAFFSQPVIEIEVRSKLRRA